MRYEFFARPDDLERIYPGITERSKFVYLEDVDVYFTDSSGQPMVQKQTVESIWEPPAPVWQINEWLSVIIDGDRVVGFYTGEIHKDSLGRRFSMRSNIEISPEKRGRGLCKEFAQFTYASILKLSVSYICINIGSLLETGACRCYMRAAQSLGLNTFASQSRKTGYQLRPVEDCNLGGLDYLIFTPLARLDQTMIDQA